MARSPASLALLVSVFVSTGACREERPPPKPVPRAPVPVEPVRQPGWTATRSFPLQSAAYRAVVVWNDAINRHDLSKFKDIYTDEVLFYGYKRSRADVTVAKRELFEKHPKFSEVIIGTVDLDRIFDDLVQATFMKSSEDHVGLVTQRLLLRGAEFLIEEESDEKSLREQETLPDGCEAKINQALDEIPEVRRITEELPRLAATSHGEATVGGYSQQPDNEGGFAWALGLFYSDRLSVHFTYGIDRSGHLTLGPPVKTQPSRAALEAVEQACRH